MIFADNFRFNYVKELDYFPPGNIRHSYWAQSADRGILNSLLMGQLQWTIFFTRLDSLWNYSTHLHFSYTQFRKVRHSVKIKYIAYITGLKIIESKIVSIYTQLDFAHRHVANFRCCSNFPKTKDLKNNSHRTYFLSTHHILPHAGMLIYVYEWNPPLGILQL